MSRANIRFYEAEGLLCPARQENGYRDYSEDDLTALLRIRLLRTLELSLDEIRAVQEGRLSLRDALEKRSAQLDQEAKRLERTRQVCRELCERSVSYDGLDARRYLDELNRQTAPDPVMAAPAPVWHADVAPRVRAPLRRWAARLLDWMLFSVLWAVLLGAVLHINPARSMPWSIYAFLVLDWAVEPHLLHRFGTTPGKWLLGLRVVGPDGTPPDGEQARERTNRVLLWGLGLYLPVFSTVRRLMSLKRCVDGDELPWEQETSLVLRDGKRWRTVAAVGAWLVLLACSELASRAAVLPPNRAPLTVAAFAQNYNHYVDYYGYSDTLHLDSEGRNAAAQEEGVFVVMAGSPELNTLPEFAYEVDENGLLRRVVLTVELPPARRTDWLSVPTVQPMLAAMAMARAQPAYDFLNGSGEHAFFILTEDPFVDYERQLQQVRFSRSLVQQGYLETGMNGLLLPAEDREQSLSFRFCVEVIGK